MVNPNMKFKDMCQSFWDTYARVNEEEVKNNTDMLTVAWQRHKGFEALVAHIKSCLMYDHFATEVIPD